MVRNSSPVTRRMKDCPVLALREYEARTAPTRGSRSMLFLSINKPHKPVSSSTIAKWLKSLLNKAGVDTEIFKAHSVQSASTSSAAKCTSGITTGNILKVADWSSEAVFQNFTTSPSNQMILGRQYCPNSWHSPIFLATNTC